MTNKRKLVQVLIGIAILALLFYKIDIHDVIAAIRSVNIGLFVAAACSYFCYNLFMAYRLYYLLDRLGNKVRFRHSFFAHFAGMIASDVTPGRAGFFLVPYFLKNRTNCSISVGMAAILAPQGIEFILKVVGGFIGLVFFITAVSMNLSTNVLLSLCISGAIFGGLGVVMLWILWTDESLSGRVVAKIPYIKKFKDGFMDMKAKSILIRDSIPIILIIYLICWLFLALQWQLIGLSLGITGLSFLAYFLLHPLITLIRFVPATVSGLGLMEGTTALMFHMLGIPNGMAIGLSFALVVRLNMILVNCIGLKGVFSGLNR